jgi:flavin-binding protein dodecin
MAEIIGQSMHDFDSAIKDAIASWHEGEAIRWQVVKFEIDVNPNPGTVGVYRVVLSSSHS